MKFEDIISIVNCVLSLIVTFSVVICTAVPNIRKKIAESFLKTQKSEELEKKIDEILQALDEQKLEDEKLRQKLELLTDADLCVIRDKITAIYYKELPTKTLRTYELENLTKLYTLYIKLGGNSYIQNIYKIMTEEWEVVQ